MRKPSILAGAFVSAALFGPSVLAAPQANVSYDYAGLHYIEQDLDNYDCNQDGLSAYASTTIDGSWFALGEVTDVSGNRGCGSTTIALGGGYHMALNRGWDAYGTLSVERTDPDNGASESGLVAAVGVRGWIVNNLEAQAELAHHTSFDDTTAVNLGANYWFLPRLAATFSTHFSDDDKAIALGARLNF